MQSIQQMIETVLSDAQPVVLAMIVQVEGSAYRKEGTWMLFQEDGAHTGIISGGCLESDLHSRAIELFNTGKVGIVHYDLSAEDDLGWGRGAGCNGVVSVFMRDIDKVFRHYLTLMHKRLLAKEPVLLIQSITNFNNYAFLNESKDCFDNWQGEIPFELNAFTPFQNSVGQTSKGDEDEIVYFQLIWPQPALYIIGAGVDARPLAQLACNVGYAVHLFDWRSALCNEIHFPTVASIQIGDTEKLIANISLSPLDSVVIMTHDFQFDAKLMHTIRDHQLLYLGILGSKKRTKRLLGGEIPNWIHSPVGLSIGADGPEEIAVSIVAELIAVRRGKN
ncbi:XdhC family protein [Sporosarcina sp. E16_8]|uniref:XdhC family protein n=1 Tax=Sporosarcina sp. E16_8 TaxID=2789295 RepID=UPI001A9388B3|nr:XdhC family protein [Sporosarcina sp. E16_8]MBO0586852.1 XdhC family protein [Sporosarcina sp. E16_8]